QMGSKQAQADDELEEMLLAFQDKLICGVYEAIYDLDEASLDTIMLCQAQACMATFLDFTGLTSPMPLDSLQDAMRNARPFGADIRQEGNVIYWTGNERGHCVCPLVRRGVIRLDPKLCICGACWVKHLFEK
ncbi:MAG: hypothetical protein GTN71_06535, partial [Anaerolineae bacterium]|nr:hypothetical protein [Anaerolineae bacterium]NIO68695.1 hypothetical protein [Anaerolineae bacterium]